MTVKNIIYKLHSLDSYYNNKTLQVILEFVYILFYLSYKIL